MTDLDILMSVVKSYNAGYDSEGCWVILTFQNGITVKLTGMSVEKARSVRHAAQAATVREKVSRLAWTPPERKV